MLDMQVPNKPEELKDWMFAAIKAEEPTQERLFDLAAKVFMWQDYAQAVEGHLKKMVLMMMKLGSEYNSAVSVIEKIHEVLHAEPEGDIDPLAQFFMDASGHDEEE
jgi:uncharacterized radical SAM superfamily Fe-S cluster-containing enzyme